MITVKCPGCGQLLSLADQHAGAVAACPKCRATFRVPAAAPPVPPPPPQPAAPPLAKQPPAKPRPTPPPLPPDVEEAAEEVIDLRPEWLEKPPPGRGKPRKGAPPPLKDE